MNKGDRLRGPNRKDEWELGEAIGGGNFGEVRRATRVNGFIKSVIQTLQGLLSRDGNSEKSVIKIIDREFQNYEGDSEEDKKKKSKYAKRIENVLSKVKDFPNVVRYEDWFRLPVDGKDAGFRLIIRMEELIPLKKRTQEKPMDEREIAKLGLDICSALEACQEQGIIHRDIKPANILVTETGDYKLCDFGIAYIPMENHTTTALHGTPLYMPLETQADLYTIDTYSLGLVLYHLLYHISTGDQLSNEKELQERINGTPLPLLRDVNQNLDESLCKIVEKACNQDPSNRYPLAKLMKEDLQHYLDGEKIFQWMGETQWLLPPLLIDDDNNDNNHDDDNKPPEPIDEPSFFSKWQIPIIAAVMVALLVAVGACWILLNAPPPSEVDINLQTSGEKTEADSGDSETFSGESEITNEGSETSDGDTESSAPEEIKPMEVKLDRDSAELKEGGELQLNATVLPENATNQTVTWSSSDSDIASVSGGLVKANGTGTATITAKSGDCTAICKVTVVPQAAPVIDVTEIRVNPTSHKMTVGDEPFQLSAMVLPENATNRNVTWSSDNPGVASVSGGLVKVNGIGTATITAKSGDCTATCAVTVVPIEVTGVYVNPTPLEMTIGEVQLLNATVSPKNATNQEISWSSSEPSVASVSDGLVKANGTGRATITAKSGNYKATCAVTVLPITVTGVRVNPASLGMMVGEEQRLSATVSPENATIYSVIDFCITGKGGR